jgi:hypothetical protein
MLKRCNDRYMYDLTSLQLKMPSTLCVKDGNQKKITAMLVTAMRLYK